MTRSGFCIWKQKTLDMQCQIVALRRMFLASLGKHGPPTELCSKAEHEKEIRGFVSAGTNLESASFVLRL